MLNKKTFTGPCPTYIVIILAFNCCFFSRHIFYQTLQKTKFSRIFCLNWYIIKNNKALFKRSLAGFHNQFWTICFAVLNLFTVD